MALPKGEHHPLNEIYTEVEAFLEQDFGGEGVSIRISRMDSRLRLNKCSEPLLMEYQNRRRHGGRAVVEVRCVAEKPWRIYVTAHIRKTEPVVVVQVPLLKGEKVERNHLAYEDREVSRLRQGYFESFEQVEGRYAKRAIRAATVLTPHLIYIPNLINKGDQVSILVQIGELRVQMKGIALEDGHRDGKIRVKNSSSGKIVEGIAIAPSQVLVGQ